MTRGQKEHQRNKKIANEIRGELIEKLGSKCIFCGSTEKLEFDHIHGITWDARKVNRKVRMQKFKIEVEQGLIQLLCRSCNAQKQ